MATNCNYQHKTQTPTPNQHGFPAQTDYSRSRRLRRVPGQSCGHDFARQACFVQGLLREGPEPARAPMPFVQAPVGAGADCPGEIP